MTNSLVNLSFLQGLIGAIPFTPTCGNVLIFPDTQQKEREQNQIQLLSKAETYRNAPTGWILKVGDPDNFQMDNQLEPFREVVLPSLMNQEFIIDGHKLIVCNHKLIQMYGPLVTGL